MSPAYPAAHRLAHVFLLAHTPFSLLRARWCGGEYAAYPFFFGCNPPQLGRRSLRQRDKESHRPKRGAKPSPCAPFQSRLCLIGPSVDWASFKTESTHVTRCSLTRCLCRLTRPNARLKAGRVKDGSATASTSENG